MDDRVDREQGLRGKARGADPGGSPGRRGPGGGARGGGGAAPGGGGAGGAGRFYRALARQVPCGGGACAAPLNGGNAWLAGGVHDSGSGLGARRAIRFCRAAARRAAGAQVGRGAMRARQYIEGRHGHF
ncbi:MAG: hypothetical protein DMD36_05435 [Gemmatimonadetes bacterium]|nr:MAG: hypothetical protein DMD36_05435 [Gemmatimonadota bacterium]